MPRRAFAPGPFSLLLLCLVGCGGGEGSPATPDAGSDSGVDAGPEPLPEAVPCGVPPPALESWRLAADGTLLRDALGRIVVLRGMNTGGRNKFGPYMPFPFSDETDFDDALEDYWDRMAAWAFSAARIPFTWEAVEPTQGEDDEVFLSRFDRMVDAAWARGIRVVVDFHQDVYAQMYCGDGFPEWTIPDELRQERPEDCSGWFFGYLRNDNVRAAFDRFWSDEDGIQSAYFALWDRMVARYADRPGVVGFEAINEPGWGTANVRDWERDVLSPFYATFAERVRRAAPEALVFVDTTGTDALEATTALVDPGVPGIAFAPHFYDPNTLVTGEYVPGDAVADAIGRWADVGIDWDVPVLLGEFGIDQAAEGVREYLRDHMNALDWLGMGGTAWEYSVADELWSGEDMSIVEPDGRERDDHVDGLVRPFLRAAAGRDTSSRYHAERRIFVGALTPDPGGITEIALPDRVYPDGVRVGLVGGCAEVDTAGRVVRIRADDDAMTLELDLRPR